jgi:predicted MFS family arabinose efflux permease
MTPMIIAPARAERLEAAPAVDGRIAGSSFRAELVIGLLAFLTVVDLFATQAILPSLVRMYGVSPAAMGTAVNASTLGMAVAGLVVAFASRHIDRRRGATLCLAVLALPTALLAAAPDLATFAALRIVQGLCMAAAFTLTLAHLAETTHGAATAAGFAAYITGNVASNLFGRLLSASLADTLGVATSFTVFAALNVAGALLAWIALRHRAADASGVSSLTVVARDLTAHLPSPLAGEGSRVGGVPDPMGWCATPIPGPSPVEGEGSRKIEGNTGQGRNTIRSAAATAGSPLAIWRRHLADPALRSAFAIGFCILFAFIGTFTYVNFVLARPPLSIGMMSIGIVYFVFLPSIFTTPLAGRFAARFGVRATLTGALALALAGLPLLLAPRLAPVLAGLTLVGVGTFFAQAAATGFVGRAAGSDPGAASGLYLASYFLGGLAGSAVLGQVFVTLGWTACVGGIALAILAAIWLAHRLDG